MNRTATSHNIQPEWMLTPLTSRTLSLTAFATESYRAFQLFQLTQRSHSLFVLLSQMYKQPSPVNET